MDFQTLKLELQKRCQDLAQMNIPDVRCGEALNQAIGQYPHRICTLGVDGTTLNTVKDQREYALEAVPLQLEAAWQVRRVWIDDSDGTPHEIGRYEVREGGGKPVLVLDELPDGAYDITVEYWIIPDVMSSPTHFTQADDEWLILRALVNLAGEMDWSKDPQLAATRLEQWNNRLVLRERQLAIERRRTSRRARTSAWRQYIG